MTNKKELSFDVVILGSGPAGFSAAIYACRGNVKTAMIDISMFGGQPSNYLELENYPGFSLVGGYELMEKFEEHADKFGVEKFPMQEITNIDLISDIKTIETDDKIFMAKTIIIATGAQAQKLKIPGETEFIGRGVSYCAVCDGAFFKEKVIAVVGGGNAAIEEAMYLTKFAKKVYVIHRRNSLRADKIVQQRAFGNEKIEFIFDAVPLEVLGGKSVEKLLIADTKTKEEREIKVDGVFPYIGFTPNVSGFNGQIQQNEAGFVTTDKYMQTSVPGVYAVGDVRNSPLRQVITAASDGAVAAYYAVKYLEELAFETLVESNEKSK